MNVDLSADQLFKADIVNLIRLAGVLKIDLSKIIKKPDAKWRIACAIVRYYKLNPQPKRKKNKARTDKMWNKL